MFRFSGPLFVLAVTAALYPFNPIKAQDVVPEESADERVVVDTADEFDLSSETSLSFWAEEQIGEFLQRDEGCIRSRVLAYGWSGFQTEYASGLEVIVISDRFGLINLLIQRGSENKDNDPEILSLIAQVNQSDWIIVDIKGGYLIITDIDWWTFLGDFSFWDDIYADMGEIMTNVVGFVPVLNRSGAKTLFAQPEGFTPIRKEDGQVCRFFFAR